MTWQVAYDEDGWGAVLRTGPQRNSSDLLREAVDAAVKYPIDTFVWNVEEQVVPFRSDIGDQQQKVYGNAADWMLREGSQAVFEMAPRIVVEAVRAKGIAGFLGFRVNDPHDRHRPWLRPRLKLDHPEYQLGGGYLPLDIARTFEGPRWSCYDFSIQQVRDHKLSLIEAILRNPHDGLFLDFFRHPFFFNPADIERGWVILTGFMEETRALAGDRPLWVRVPADLSICRWAGIDLREWIRRRLVDSVVCGGGNVIFEQPDAALVEFCHEHGVTAHLCMDAGVARHTPDRQRAAARSAQARGLDGVYMFNLYIPGRDRRLPGQEYDYSVLEDLCDPDRLDSVSKTYAIEEKEERPINTHFEPQGRVPFQLTPANAADGYTRSLFVGDSLTGQRMSSADLTIELEEIAVHDDEIGVGFNGQRLDGGGLTGRAITRSDAGALMLVYDVAGLVRSGENQLMLTLRHRVANLLTNITVVKVELRLEYR